MLGDLHTDGIKVREDWTTKFREQQRALSPFDAIRKIVFFDRVLYQGIRKPSRAIRWGIVIYGVVYIVSAFGLMEGAVELFSEAFSDGVLSVFPAIMLALLGCLMLALGAGIVKNGVIADDKRTHPLPLHFLRSRGRSERGRENKR